MNIAELSIKRPVLMSMVIVALILFGFLAFTTLPTNITPSVELPYVVVQVQYTGASPDLIESQITKKVEDAVSMISGLEQITSYSLENVALILLEFEMGKDQDTAVQETTNKVDNILGDLPEGAEAPEIIKININELPIVNVLLAGDSNQISMTELYELADKKIKNRFSQVNGVGETTLTGGLEREIHVEFDNKVVFQNQISLVQVNNILAASNINLPTGTFHNNGQEYSVKFDGEFKTTDAVGELEIPTGKGFKKIKDVATVTDSHEKARERTIYFNFKEDIRNDNAILFEISKTSEGNAVEIYRGIEKVIKDISRELPSGVNLYITAEEASVTQRSIDDTMSNIILGIVFTAVILLFFLHSFRSTIIVAITMPISIIPTFITMKIMGYSLNIMSLMGLSTAVGVLVMNSVVILENIFRHKELGEPGKVAASKGTTEIAVAVLASALTNVAVFLPLGTMNSIIGQFLAEFALAVVFATLFSLFIAFTLTPMLAAYILPEKDTRKHPIGDKLEAMFKSWEAGYRKQVEKILKNKKRCFLVILFSFAMFVVSMYCFKYIPFEFMPDMDEGKIEIEMELAKGTDLEATTHFTETVEERLRKYTDYIDQGTTTIGRLSFMDTGVNVAKITLSLVPKQDRPYSTSQMAGMITKDLSDLPGAVIRAGSAANGPSSSPIDFYLKGPDMKKLEEYKNQIYPIIERIPGVMNLNTTSKSGAPEITITPDLKKISDAGTSVQEIAVTLRTALDGMDMTQFKEGGEEYDIKVILLDENIKSYDDIRNVMISTPKGIFPVSQFVDIKYTEGFNKITRSDREKVIEFTADVAPGYAQSIILAEIEKVVSGVDFSYGYMYQPAGNAEEMTETMTQMAIVFIIAIVLTYMLLAAILENLWQPVLILFTIPLAMIGVVGIFLITGIKMNFIGMMAIIMLVGMVVNNAILILDYTNQLRREQGMSMKDALIEACPTKLKAILMSNIATILGLLPMAMGIGEQGVEMRQPMGLVSVGGLLVSTVLTLYIIPASQFLMARSKKKQKKQALITGAEN